MPQHNTSRRVSVAEAARITGLHHYTIRRYIAEGRLPACRMGPKLIRIDTADLDALSSPVDNTA